MTSPAPLTIVLPCFNPSTGWAANVLTNLAKIEERLGFMPRLVLVNDGSDTAETRTGIRTLSEAMPDAAIVEYEANRGKGHALRRGVAEASTDYVIFTDVDFPYSHESFMRIWEALAAGSDVAIGHRDASYYAHVPFVRRVISRSFRFVVERTFRLRTSDTQSGLKGFNARGRDYFLATRTDRYLFDLEFVHACSRDPRLRLTPVPVELNPGVTFRRMSPRVLFLELVNLLRIWARRSDR
jgi:glycosyltransferase involved in cell wall biosynthesis